MDEGIEVEGEIRPIEAKRRGKGVLGTREDNHEQSKDTE